MTDRNVNDNQKMARDVLNLLDEMEKEIGAASTPDSDDDWGFVGDFSDTDTDLAAEPPVDELDLLLIPGLDDEDEEEAEAEQRVPLLTRVLHTESENDDTVPAPPNRRNPFAVLWSGFCSNLPARGDSGITLVRKCGFLISLAVLLFSLGYLLVDLCIQPWQNQQLSQELVELYQPDNQMQVADTTNYPAGMLASFKELYQRNDEVRGWLTFHATGKNDFLNIDYPVMYSGDNDKYLTLDFDEKKNKNGALFFDQNNKLETKADKNKSTIIYGHNMASGQMLAGLNKLLGNVNNARAASTFTLSTLFRRYEYQVFAVILTEEAETNPDWYFNTRRTNFVSEEDFLAYVEEMRARSIYDYPVEVQSGDEIVVLSTCTGKSSAKVKDGRLVVVARRNRGAEVMDTTKIVKNEDVIMPRNWYVNQGLPLHPYYEGDYVGTVSTTTTTGRTDTSDTSDTSDISDVSGTGSSHSTYPTYPTGSTGTTTGSTTQNTSAPTSGTTTTTVPSDVSSGSDISIPGDTSIPFDTSIPDDTSIPFDTSIPDDTSIPSDTSIPEDTSGGDISIVPDTPQ